MSGYSPHKRWVECSDVELLRRSTAEPEAFGEFYGRHVRSVLAFLMRRTASADVAAELAAETFAKAFSSRHRFRDVGAPARAWVIGIANHELKKWLRRGRVRDAARRKLQLPRLEADDESLERIEALVDFGPLREHIRDALAQLSPTVREALVLRVGLELPYSEVAAKLGCSEGAARVRVARGLSQFAEMLEVSP